MFRILFINGYFCKYNSQTFYFIDSFTNPIIFFMKKLTTLLLICSVWLSISCTKPTEEDPAAKEQTTIEVLINNPWKIERITDLSGNVINTSNLPEESRAMFGINIKFNEDKTVRAIDPTSKVVVNGGSWDFFDNQQTLDINVSQLKGKFPIVKLERSRMILRNQVVFQGIGFDVNLELVPSL